VVSQRNNASLQPCREVNVAIATTALPVARFLRSLALVEASQDGASTVCTGSGDAQTGVKVGAEATKDGVTIFSLA